MPAPCGLAPSGLLPAKDSNLVCQGQNLECSPITPTGTACVWLTPSGLAAVVEVVAYRTLTRVPSRCDTALIRRTVAPGGKHLRAQSADRCSASDYRHSLALPLVTGARSPGLWQQASEPGTRNSKARTCCTHRRRCGRSGLPKPLPPGACPPPPRQAS